MTSVALRHLLDLYKFLDSAEDRHGDSMPAEVRGKVRSERADVLRQLLDHPADDPAVTVAQLRALMSCLAGAQEDAGLAKLVTQTCQVHLDRLVQRIDPVRSPIEVEISQFGGCCKPLDAVHRAKLNHASQRIIVISPEFRYLFSNTANCQFFAKDPSFFINRPMWDATGVAFFERVNRPAFGSCFSGRSASYVSPHPGHDPSVLYECRAEPIRDAKGGVVAALGVVTELTCKVSVSTTLN